MVETIRYSKLYKEDIAIGSGVAEVELNAGEVVQLNELNLSAFHDGDNNVLYASSDATTDSVFTYDPTNNRLFVPEIAGGSGSGDDLRLKSTTHATDGVVTLQEDGGNVGIGLSSPLSKLHIEGSSGVELLIDETSTGDPKIAFSLSSIDKYILGIDNSDADKFKLENGGTLGVNNNFVMDSSGNISIGTATADGLFHIFVSNTTVTPQTDADELIIETNGDNGITIASSTTGTSSIRFSRSTLPTAGAIQYDHANDLVTFDIGGSEAFRFNVDSGLLINTTSTDSFLTSGIVIDLAGNDDSALVFKDTSSIAHDVTSHAETATFGFFDKHNDTTGGMRVAGISEDEVGLTLWGVAVNENITDTSSSQAVIEVNARIRSSTTVTNVGATGNAFLVRSGSSALFLVKGNGDLHNAGSGTLVTLDDYDDVKLLKSVKGAMAPNYRQTIGEWFSEHARILEESGVIKRNGDGYWVSQYGWRGLVVDAFGQQDSRITGHDEDIRQLNKRLAELESNRPG